MAFWFTMISVFLPLEKHSFSFFFFLNFIWHLSLLHLPADGMLSMSWGCHHLTLFPRNAGLLPAHVQEQSHFPRTLLHPLWIFCLIAGRNQNTETIWVILKGRKKKGRFIKRGCNKSQGRYSRERTSTEVEEQCQQTDWSQFSNRRLAAKDK